MLKRHHMLRQRQRSRKGRPLAPRSRAGAPAARHATEGDPTGRSLR